MNILVVTDVLWRNDNGVGNSYSNIFEGMDGVNIANVCCASGVSKNDVVKRCFQISEGRLIANLKNKSIPSGNEEVHGGEAAAIKPRSSIIKKLRLQIFFWARDLIWMVGRWKSKELCEFLDDFKPDLIFAQVQDKMYQNRLVSFIKDYTNKSLVAYVWDDVYTLKQFRLSPLYWIDRFMQRCSIKRLVSKCSILYTIAKEQKDEYAKIFGIKTELLYKGRDFSYEPEDENLNEPIKMIYTGNLYSGRVKTMLELCRFLDEINRDTKKVELSIYSATPLSGKEREGLGDTYKGSVTEKEVQELQKESDVLLHIEPFSLKGSLLCRLSFSTKLVDYFHKKKCIFAVGHSRCSSMRYLKCNDSAICCESIDEMKKKLAEIICNRDIVKEYAKKAWDCGARNHRIEDIQKRLMEDFEEVINEGSLDS